MKKILFFISVLVTLYACEEVIEVNLDEGEPVFVVDAWINNKPEAQVIKLRQSIPYFSNRFADPIIGARVAVISEDSIVYNFLDEDNDGDYIWGGDGQVFGQVGKEYSLLIEHDGQIYYSLSEMMPTTPVDSIVYEYDSPFGLAPGLYAQFYAKDILGEGNTYWIKTYKNGEYLSKPQEINVAYDAAFSEGIDGLVFIEPIRRSINPFPDGMNPILDKKPPYEVGDTIRVEIHSVKEEAYYYLVLMFRQLTLGDAGIFAEPSTNLPSNIINTTDSSKQPQGLFSVSATSSLTVVVEE